MFGSRPDFPSAPALRGDAVERNDEAAMTVYSGRYHRQSGQMPRTGPRLRTSTASFRNLPYHVDVLLIDQIVDYMFFHKANA